MSSDVDPTRFGSNRVSRRTLLALTGAGMTGLAGCLGDDGSGNGGDGNGGGGNGTDGTALPDGAHVEGQELVVPMAQNPNQLYFLPDWGPAGTALETDMVSPTDLRPVLWDTGMWSRAISSAYGPAPGELYPALFSDFELEPQVMTVTIQEDAGWSDGEPVTAFDLAAPFTIQQASVYNEELDNPTAAAENPEEASWFPVQDIEMPDGKDGKVVEYHNWDWDEYPAWEEVNGFEYPNFSSIYTHLLSPTRRRGQVYPMHQEPWGTILEERWEWRQNHKVASDDPQTQQRWQDWIAERASVEDLQATREPGNFPACGAWKLEEIRGAQEVVVSPNEHHYAADQVNFDRIRFQWFDEERRTEASLNAGDLDYGSVNATPETAQSFPDIYERINSPAYEGYAISFNHNSVYGDRRVRAALMYALNAENIAQNVNPNATAPITVPGGDMWAIDAVISQDWIDETLIDYSQDRDRATELMEAAGFSRQDGVWTKDGQPLQASLATFANNPIFEETVVSQLSEFGVEAESRTLDEAQFNEQWTGVRTKDQVEDPDSVSGNFDIWRPLMGGGIAGYYTYADYYWYATVNRRDRVRAHNFYEHEVQEAGMAGELSDQGYAEGDYSWSCVPACQREWTIDVPPIGEPDGEPQPFNPSAVVNATIFSGYDYEDPFTDWEYYNPPHDEPHEENAEYYWKKFFWTTNWFLPSLPVVLNEDQHFLNNQNWRWPKDHAMWEYFGMSWDVNELAGMGRIQADPDNPK